MHTRSLRMALLSSLGLIPLGCAQGDAVDGLQLRAADASVEPVPDGREATPLEDGGASELPVRDSGASRLASCGPSTAVPGEELPPGIVRRSWAAAEGVFSGIEQCANGVLHRPASVTCSVGLPRPVPPGPGAGNDAGSEAPVSQVAYLYEVLRDTPDASSWSCESDADCTEQPYGYCAPRFDWGFPADALSAQCNYGCAQDADCGAGFLCQCDDPVGRCVPADCRNDSECGGESLCAAWFRDAGCTQEQVYSCQSPGDQCNTEADCSNQRCSVVDGARQCVAYGPLCGRPFLVEGAARLAALRLGSDWVGDVLPEVKALSPAQRDLAAELWARNALMEHASIAAFARFTLQLMHLGAPRELVERSQRAMLDETAPHRARGRATRNRARRIGAHHDRRGRRRGARARRAVRAASSAAAARGAGGGRAAVCASALVVGHCRGATART